MPLESPAGLGIYERRAYLTEVYRNALAREVIKLGYAIEDRHEPSGHDAGFEIRGVSDELLGKFSQRSRQRDSAIELFTTKNGRPPTDNEIAILVRESRADKLIEISTAEVTKRLKARLGLSEDRMLNDLHRTALESGVEVLASREAASCSVNYAQEHIFERVSVASEHELLTEALRHGRGRIDLDEAKGGLRLQQASGAILRAGNEVATRETLDRERAMIASVNRGVGRLQGVFEPNVFQGRFVYPQEEVEIEPAVLDRKGRVIQPARTERARGHSASGARAIVCSCSGCARGSPSATGSPRPWS
jgi:predicted peroxiredoxin